MESNFGEKLPLLSKASSLYNFHLKYSLLSSQSILILLRDISIIVLSGFVDVPDNLKSIFNILSLVLSGVISVLSSFIGNNLPVLVIVALLPLR